MAITQLRGGLPGRRYGSFAGRAAGAPDGPHPVGRLTQLRGGLAGRRYGAFAGKTVPKPPAHDDGDFWSLPYYYQRRVWRRTPDMAMNLELGETLYLGTGEDKTFGFDFSKEGAVRDGGVLSDPVVEVTLHSEQTGSPGPPSPGDPDVVPSKFTDSDGKSIKPGKGVRVRLTADDPGKYVVSCSVTVTDVDGADDVLKGGGVLVVE